MKLVLGIVLGMIAYVGSMACVGISQNKQEEEDNEKE